MNGVSIPAARPRIRRVRARRRRGVMIILIAILLMVFLATLAFSIDVAYMHLVNAELRASTDAAAKAAVTTLVVTEDEALARQAAIDIAQTNLVAGNPLPLVSDDIIFGGFTLQPNGRFTFDPDAIPPVAARVVGHRDQASSAGKVSLFFGGMLGTPDFSPTRVATAIRLERDIVLVLDRSGSMSIGTQMDDLKAAVDVFLDMIRKSPFHEQIGVVSYDDVIAIEANLDEKTNVASTKVKALTPRGMTNIGDAILSANTVLEGTNSRGFAEKTIILMTDGVWNTGPDPAVTAVESSTKGYTIHTITFGAGADQTSMLAVANTTGGIHFHAADGTQLLAVYESIARTLTTVLIN